MIRLKDILTEEVVEDIDFVNKRMNGSKTRNHAILE